MSVGSNATTYVLDQDLEDLLRSVFDVQSTDNHEVLEALSFSHTKTWTNFMKLVDEDVEKLSRSVPIIEYHTVPVVCLVLNRE